MVVGPPPPPSAAGLQVVLLVVNQYSGTVQPALAWSRDDVAGGPYWSIPFDREDPDWHRDPCTLDIDEADVVGFVPATISPRDGSQP